MEDIGADEYFFYKAVRAGMVDNVVELDVAGEVVHPAVELVEDVPDIDVRRNLGYDIL